MIRGAVACSCVLGALALVAACRQIVGIGDRVVADGGASPPACGLALPEGSCRACMEQHCCAAAEACASNRACKANEECVAACGDDSPCVDRCRFTAPAGIVAQVPALDACVASHCEAACSLSCGARAPQGGTDAAVACQNCIAANACSAQQACAGDVACQSISRCNQACTTLDCAAACPTSFEAGAPEWFTFAQQVSGSCGADCPADFGCVGHVSWPTAKASASTLHVVFTDILDSSPTSGADVKLCSKDDTACAQPLDDQPSDAQGTVTLHYTSPLATGLDGYLQITSSVTAPTLFFWNFPLTEADGSFGGNIVTLKSASVATLFATVGITPAAGHGHLVVAGFDCNHSPAAGLQFHFRTPTDASTTLFYAAAGGGVNVASQETDRSGVALVANVPVGPVVLEAQSVALGSTVSRVTFVVRDGYIGLVFLLPTPQ